MTLPLLPPGGDLLMVLPAWIELFFRMLVPMVVGIMALIGVVLVLRTRADAFDAADRKPRGTWAGLLAGCSIFLIFPWIGWLMLGIPVIASLVITGIYWLDVRPQIKDLLANAQG
ncbi:DUF2516 family protein [Corynebacterium sphenisci]|uniref:DUF2516 family protein n=1 Tax=Corynebacterium sphenisci TaxID=191493 RepID=UPI0026DF6137|nr:DUF2516 family protein [Corynebacterium sphenisci]MDO5730895.1 DUF2516 family protein [Corynebacterium sphenisci]